VPADPPRRKAPTRAAGKARPGAGRDQASAGQAPAGQIRTNVEETRLQDPRDIRALAHPARLAIIDALSSGDELTATDCATLTGLSPSATAYHLKFLERHGFAEPAPPRRDGRERPWREASHQTRFDLDTSTPAAAAAAGAVALAFLDGSRTLAQQFLAGANEEPEQWQEVASLTNADLWLSVEETRQLVAALAAALEPYRGRTLGDRRGGTRRVRVTNMVVPHR
jgi:DNA-binding transcriptional ArsR family regulator